MYMVLVNDNDLQVNIFIMNDLVIDVIYVSVYVYYITFFEAHITFHLFKNNICNEHHLAHYK